MRILTLLMPLICAYRLWVHLGLPLPCWLDAKGLGWSVAAAWEQFSRNRAEWRALRWKIAHGETLGDRPWRIADVASVRGRPERSDHE